MKEGNAVPKRWAVTLASAAAACAFIGILSLVLKKEGRAAQLLLDRNTTIFPYPLTIQNLEHLAFFIGLGELFTRWRVAVREASFLNRRYLPEDDETVLQSRDLGPIRRQVSKEFDGEHGFLPSLIDLSILQFLSSRSVDQTVSVMNSSLELIGHRVDLRYAMVRYLVWVIPTLGFIGTVVGIASTLGLVPKGGNPVLYDLAQNLYVAFDTTIVALTQSGILVFFLNVVQAREERSVNLAGYYCLRNLINRLYTGA